MTEQESKYLKDVDLTEQTLHIQSSREELKAFMTNMKSFFEYIWLIDIVVEDLNSEIRLRYIFKAFEDKKDIFIDFSIQPDEVIPSLHELWANAVPLEREIHELFGLKFDKDYSHLYFGEGTKVYPLRKKNFNPDDIQIKKYEHEADLKLNLKSSHFANQLEFKLNLDEDEVKTCSIDSGKWHIGFEKICEGKDLLNLYSSLENYFVFQGANWSTCLSINLEKSLGITIPERAMALRMVSMEFSRVLGHLNALINLAREMEQSHLYEKSLLWIKQIQTLIIRYSSNEFGHNVNRLGGVIKDVPQIWTSEVIQVLASLEKNILTEYKNITSNDQWREALSFKLLDKSSAMDWSISGPLLRATGVNLDYRKINPFYYYSDVEFDVPIGVYGQGYDVLLIRFEEIFQSFKIISQVLDNLPTGNTIATKLNTFYSTKESFDFDLNEYKHTALNLYEVHHVFSSTYIEGPNGIMGITHSLDDSKTNRLKLVSQSYFQRYLFEKVSEGKNIENIIPFWSLLNVHMKEVER